MSYRAFKRLLGETSLERKCRFLFGAGILVLITLSFWLYAYLTEQLAYNQAVTTCRLLVFPILMQQHVPYLRDRTEPPKGEMPLEGDKLVERLSLPKSDDIDRERLKYTFEFLSEDKTDKKFETQYERNLCKEFQRGETDKTEEFKPKPNEKALLYYAPIRAAKACLSCHAHANAKENEFLAMVRIRIPTTAIEEGVHWNRSLLMATALGTALLIMTGSWIIVRYIIVKPIKHLKEVSDAISAGQLNVRSEIQTGDEFEDLSHAFNRMLRNLVNMQDQWRKVSADLDRKVDQLAQANLALYESNRLKADFLATMSHELRTPLNSILGFSDVLLSPTGKGPGEGLTEKQQRWVRNIRTSGEKLLALINDILDLAKIEAGKMQVRLEEFNLDEVCDGLLNMFRPLAEKKNIDLRSQIDPGLPAMRQDLTKLQQILQNLLSNAIKFTPEGGRVLLRAMADATYVRLIVTDTGVGIAPEEQELVFEKFRQSGNPLTREHAGTGLGLSIVRELSKLLGGEVVVRSELGRGSTFTVRLPLLLSLEPRLEFDLADESIDLSKAQKVDVRLYAGSAPTTAPTRLDRPEGTVVDLTKHPAAKSLGADPVDDRGAEENVARTAADGEVGRAEVGGKDGQP